MGDIRNFKCENSIKWHLDYVENTYKDKKVIQGFISYFDNN